jgi:lipoprotein-releasing system permease protein
VIRLPFPAVLALRYLKSTRRDAFTSFLSAVAGCGIALGVMALILALSVISGFQSALKEELLGRTPQIEVELPPGTGVEEGARVRAAVERVGGVAAAQLQVRGSGWLLSRGRVIAAELVGYEGAVPRSFPGIAGKPAGLYLPSSVAGRWGIRPGEPVSLVSPRPTLTPFGPQPRIRTLTLAGTYDSGRTQQDRERAALPLAEAATLVGGGAPRLEVSAASFDGALAVAPRLAAALPRGSRVSTWRELNRPLLFALQLEKVLMFVAVSLIIAVAALALVADLSLIIANKRPEIGILGAMGAGPRELTRAFVVLGGLIAGAGIAAGTFLGVGGAFVLDRYRLVPVPGKVYFLDYVPFQVQGWDLAAVLAVTLVLALGSARYAAGRAAALDPVEAMRR